MKKLLIVLGVFAVIATGTFFVQKIGESYVKQQIDQGIALLNQSPDTEVKYKDFVLDLASRQITINDIEVEAADGNVKIPTLIVRDCDFWNKYPNHLTLIFKDVDMTSVIGEDDDLLNKLKQSERTADEKLTFDGYLNYQIDDSEKTCKAKLLYQFNKLFDINLDVELGNFDKKLFFDTEKARIKAQTMEDGLNELSKLTSLDLKHLEISCKDNGIKALAAKELGGEEAMTKKILSNLDNLEVELEKMKLPSLKPTVDYLRTFYKNGGYLKVSVTPQTPNLAALGGQIMGLMMADNLDKIPEILGLKVSHKK